MTSEQPPAHIITMSDTVMLDYRLTQSGKILERTEQIARRSQLVKGEESDSLAPFPPHKFKTGAMASWNG